MPRIDHHPKPRRWFEQLSGVCEDVVSISGELRVSSVAACEARCEERPLSLHRLRHGRQVVLPQEQMRGACRRLRWLVL